MNRERIAKLALMAVFVCWGLPAAAKDQPRPSLTVTPIFAPSLLAPIDETGNPPAGYRLGPNFDAARGKEARLSLEVGDSTLFAITGRLSRDPANPGPLDPSQAKALGLKRVDGGKVYGGGISRNIGGVDVSATYQYSKVTAGQPWPNSEAGDDGPGRSHSVRASARIRFRP